MKFVESFGATMAPVMQGQQVPIVVDGLVQQAQRLLGVTSDKVYFDAEVQTELALLAFEYYGVMPSFSWDKYNWDAQILGQKLLVKKFSLPDIDAREPLIKSMDDLDKIKWPSDNPLDCGRYPLEIETNELAAKYFPNQIRSILTVSSFSLACNICGGSNFLPLLCEEPEFCHAVIKKITDDIHTPLIKAISERFPGAMVVFADAWEVPPNISEKMMREFAWDYYDRLKENTKDMNVNLQWFVAYGEQYMKDPYAFIVEKATKYSHGINDTNLENCDPENYHRAAIDTGLPLTCFVPSTVIQKSDKQSIIDFVRSQAKALRPDVANFIYMLMCPATASEYDVKSVIAIAKAFATLPTPTPEEIEKIEVTLPEVGETFCDFVRRKKKENPDGFTFKWYNEANMSE